MSCPHCRRDTPCACRETFRRNHAIGLAFDGRPKVTPEEVARAKALRASGLTLKAIGKIIGRVPSTVFYMVRA